VRFTGRSIRTCSIAAAVIAIVLVIIWHFDRSPLERIYGRDGLRTLRHATNVVAYRVSGSRVIDAVEMYAATTRPAATAPSSPRAKLLEYDLLSGPVKLSEEQQSQLLAILTDTSTYGWGRVSVCTFNADVAFTCADADGNHVTVVLCFHCTDIHVHLSDRSDYRLDSFRSRRSDLLTLAQELFPEDASLRRLTSGEQGDD